MNSNCQCVRTASWFVLSVMVCLSSFSGTACMFATRAAHSAGTVKQPQTDAVLVEAAGARSVEVNLNLSYGQLKIGGGARNLLEGDLVHDVDSPKPQLQHTISDGLGKLILRQTCPKEGRCEKRDRCRWNLNLNDQLPMKIKIERGIGDSFLSLGTLSIDRLEVATGLGETTIDLSGNWKQDLTAHIETGMGNVILRLPSQVGVQVTVDKGIGRTHARGFKKAGSSYTNEAFGKTPRSLNLHVNCGMGSVRLELQ